MLLNKELEKPTTLTLVETNLATFLWEAFPKRPWIFISQHHGSNICKAPEVFGGKVFQKAMGPIYVNPIRTLLAPPGLA